jgi:hypothetical protein
MLKKVLLGAAAAVLAGTPVVAAPSDFSPTQVDVWKARVWCMYAGGNIRSDQLLRLARLWAPPNRRRSILFASGIR